MNLRKFYVGKAIGFVIVVALAAVLWKVVPWRDVPATVSPSPTPTPTQSQAPTPGINEPVTYTSSKLGLTFKYVPHTKYGDFAVQESDNFVYVYIVGTDPKTGQSVEVFEKRTDETLEQSIRRQILADYPSPDCTVEITYSTAPVATIAQIGYPPSTDPNEPHWANYELCNKDYSKTNGIRYFRYDEAHPDRFIFLSIGQYAIPGTSGGSIPWQETLRITAR